MKLTQDLFLMTDKTKLKVFVTEIIHAFISKSNYALLSTYLLYISGRFTHIYGFFWKAIHFAIDFNIFPSVPPSTDVYKLYTQRISTRVFIFSFLFAFLILLIYTSTITTARTITVPTPNLNQYHRLATLFPSTLTCSCLEISIKYETFIDMNPSLHQVCESVYITTEWLQYISARRSSVLSDDFRGVGMFLFQALSSLCQLVNDTIRNNLKHFYSLTYITAIVPTEKLFESQINATIDQFISATTSSFTTFLRMMRDTSQANGLVSALMTNYAVFARVNSIFFKWISRQYGDNCYCIYSSACASNIAIYQNQNRSLSWDVPGFYTGCFVLEALRQSSLECFYNQICLDELDYHLESPLSLNFIPLNSSELIRFSTDTTLGVIIDELMVDEWKWTIHYDKYYSVCSPTKCTYSITGTNSLIEIVTILIGLIGGLVISLRLIIPLLVRFVRWAMTSRTALASGMSFDVKQLSRYW